MDQYYHRYNLENFKFSLATIVNRPPKAVAYHRNFDIDRRLP